MDKKDANAILRRKYGPNWFDRPGVKAERDALIKGRGRFEPDVVPGQEPTSVRRRREAARVPEPPPVPEPPRSSRAVSGRSAARGASGLHAVLHFREGSSDKVYELRQTGSTLTVSWGRRGAKLQSKTTEFDSAASARDAFNTTRTQKMAKGYREVGAVAEDEADEDEVEDPTPARSRAARTVTTPRRTAGGPPSGVMLAKTWEGSDPTGWWMSEKLDGMRAYWSGSALYSRNGNEISTPESFRRLLPADLELDGELFLGRGKFQDTVSAVRKLAPTDPRWADVKYMVFDAPSAPGGFEDRMVVLQAAVAAACGRSRSCPLVYVDQVKCTGKAHLTRMHKEISEGGGEGVMLRRPRSAYTRTRSPDLLKVKSFGDAEAKITGYTKGTGKHAGRLGAYTAKLLDSGVEFKIGTGISDAERDRPLRVGTIVTVRFQELTRDGVPRFPSLVGPRDYE